MKIDVYEITVKELTDGYQDCLEKGVFGYSGKLDIRPPYQREFVYKPEQRNAVIDSVIKGFPINMMFWAKRDDGTFEVVDGQQRTISLCQYIHNEFSINKKLFYNLQKDEQKNILDYKLLINACSGTDSEKLKWFETINTVGAKLTKQELRNAVYSGPWVTEVKRHFSKTGCPAYKLGSDYIKGTPIRQDYLETVIKWVSDGNIENYMSKHQHDPDAEPLWEYFQNVIKWIKQTFPKTRAKFMKGVDWGTLYKEYKDKTYDTDTLEKRIAKLIADDDVKNKKGIYPYVLTGDEQYLNIRTFTDAMRQKVYEKQNGICAITGEKMDISEMEADHIIPWSKGGSTVEENCQMVSMKANRRKSAK